MSKTLPFGMQTQEQQNWCWSAVSVSADAFFSAPTPWTQCLLVNDQFQRNDCCGNGSSTPCDQPWFLERALSRVNRLRDGPASGRPTDVAVFQEIDAGRPVGLRIRWTGSNLGHFVLVTGYDDTDPSSIRFEIDDPYYGHSTVDAATFPSNYQSGGGSWSHTYLIG
jgi:hypothetical protein